MLQFELEFEQAEVKSFFGPKNLRTYMLVSVEIYKK
jgi:hypothetical protein